MLWSTAAFDEQSGKTLTYKLKKPKLAPDANRSQLPNCPPYLSQPTSTERSIRDNILQRKELHAVKTVEASGKDCEEQQTKNNVLYL